MTSAYRRNEALRRDALAKMRQHATASAARDVTTTTICGPLKNLVVSLDPRRKITNARMATASTTTVNATRRRWRRSFRAALPSRSQFGSRRPGRKDRCTVAYLRMRVKGNVPKRIQSPQPPTGPRCDPAPSTYWQCRHAGEPRSLTRRSCSARESTRRWCRRGLGTQAWRSPSTRTRTSYPDSRSRPPPPSTSRSPNRASPKPVSNR